MNIKAIHTSDKRRADRIWLMLGGEIADIRCTGEKRYTHSNFDAPLRANGRRHDPPAKLLSRINQLLRTRAANDEVWID